MPPKTDRKYNELVKPNFNKIVELIERGETIKDICQEIGISRSYWDLMIQKKPEFRKVVYNAKKDNRGKIYLEPDLYDWWKEIQKDYGYN